MDAINRAVLLLKRGKVIIFPTETLYAIGCNALNKGSLLRLYQIKNRPCEKRVPIVIGDLFQLDLITEIPCWFPLGLIRDRFWPGPLSILLPAKSGLPKCIVNPEGKVCVRFTPHPITQKLCVESGLPLVASSANFSGMPAPDTFEKIDKDLIKEVDLVLNLPPIPSGGNPSTIIEFLGKTQIKIIRKGAISRESLKEAGFVIIN